MSVREMESLLAEAEDIIRRDQSDFVRVCSNVKKLKRASENAKSEQDALNEEVVQLQRRLSARQRRRSISRIELYDLLTKLDGFHDSIMLQYTKLHSNYWLAQQKQVGRYLIKGSATRYVIAKLLSHKKLPETARCQLASLMDLPLSITLDPSSKQFIYRLISSLVKSSDTRKLYFELLEQGYSLYALNTDNPIAEIVGAYPLDHIVKLQAYIEKYRMRLDCGAPTQVVFADMLKHPFQYLRFSKSTDHSLDRWVNREIESHTDAHVEAHYQALNEQLQHRISWAERTQESFESTCQTAAQFDRVLYHALVRQVSHAFYLYTSKQVRRQMYFIERHCWHKKTGKGVVYARDFVARMQHIGAQNYVPNGSYYAEACQQFICYLQQTQIKLRDYSFATYLLKVLFSDKQGLFARHFGGASISVLYKKRLEELNCQQQIPPLEEQPFGIVKQLSKKTASTSRCFGLFQRHATQERLIARSKVISLILEQKYLIEAASAA